MQDDRTTARRNTLIVLYVDTANITEKTKYEYSLFRDSSGDTGESAVNFESNVITGGYITWVGVARYPTQTPDDYVVITDIVEKQHHPPQTYLTDITNEPKQPGTHVTAKVQPNIPQGTEFDYSITFHVHKIIGGRDTKESYTIDPRLKIH